MICWINSGRVSVWLSIWALLDQCFLIPQRLLISSDLTYWFLLDVLDAIQNCGLVFIEKESKNLIFVLLNASWQAYQWAHERERAENTCNMNIDCLEIRHPLSWELSHYASGQETHYSASFGIHPVFLWIRGQPTYLGSGGKLRQTTTQARQLFWRGSVYMLPNSEDSHKRGALHHKDLFSSRSSFTCHLPKSMIEITKQMEIRIIQRS